MTGVGPTELQGDPKAPTTVPMLKSWLEGPTLSLTVGIASRLNQAASPVLGKAWKQDSGLPESSRVPPTHHAPPSMSLSQPILRLGLSICGNVWIAVSCSQIPRLPVASTGQELGNRGSSDALDAGGLSTWRGRPLRSEETKVTDSPPAKDSA